MKKIWTLIISLLVVAIFILPTGCKKAEEPSKASVPAPAPALEQKPSEAPALIPGEKASEVSAPSPKTKLSETPVTKQKAQEPSKAPAHAPVPEKKATEAPAPPPKKEIAEDSIYIAQSTITRSEGNACTEDDQAKKAVEEAAMADAKRKAVEQVITDIKAKTKDAELKKDLVSAYTDFTIGNVEIIQKTLYKDDSKRLCFKLKIKAEVIPDVEKIKKLMKE